MKLTFDWIVILQRNLHKYLRLKQFKIIQNRDYINDLVGITHAFWKPAYVKPIAAKLYNWLRIAHQNKREKKVSTNIGDHHILVKMNFINLV